MRNRTPFHKFITFQVWLATIIIGLIASVAILGPSFDSVMFAMMVYPWLGLILGVAANELTDGHVTEGI